MNSLRLIRNSYHCADPRRESEDPSEQYRCPHCEQMVYVGDGGDFDGTAADTANACLDLGCCAKCLPAAAVAAQQRLTVALNYRALNVSAKEHAAALARLIVMLGPLMSDELIRLTLTNAQIQAQILLDRLQELEQ